MSPALHSDARKLRAAVVGCGTIGRLHASAVRSSPVGQLVAVCDVDPARGVLAAELGVPFYTDHAQMLAAVELDVVTVATPDHLHVPPVLSALSSGCHVFCEKPLATQLEEARFLSEEAVRRERHLSVDFNRRFGFGYQQARAWIQQGRIGRVEHVWIHVTDGSPSQAVAQEPHVMLTTLLVHHFDLLRCLGGEIRTVFAAAGRGVRGLVRQMTIHVEFATGGLGAIVAGYLEGQTRTRERCVVNCQLGEITVEDVGRSVSVRGLDPDEITVRRPDLFGRGDVFQATITAHLHDFLDAIHEGREPTVTAHDALASMAVAQAARESIATQQRVTVLSHQDGRA